MSASAGFLPRALLNAGHTLFTGSLMALSVGGISAVVYGVYSLVFVRPRVQAQLAQEGKGPGGPAGGAISGSDKSGEMR